ncbi:MAG: IS607 family transposase, partial [Kamptonema sp. SIO4C4]|nr:IS607 family transposase [Kamptonema sp. SIO4C4]
MSKYVPARIAQEKLGVSLRTLLRWDEAGKIETIRTPNGQRRYNVESVLNYSTSSEYHPSPSEKAILLYARVSSPAQKPELERQADFLLTRFPQGELVKEIASGLNFKRKKLRDLLERVLTGDVSMVVVCHKDRLARFGVELIQWLCERQGCQLVVLQQSDL